MIKLKHVIVVLIIFAAIIALFAWESNVDRILANLNDLNDAISKTGLEGGNAVLTKALTLNRLCTKDCVLRVEDSRIGELRGKEAILAYFRTIWPQLTPQQAIFEAVRINVDETGQAANCTLTAYLLEEGNNTERRRTEEFEVSMDWLKHDGEWQVDCVTGILPEE